MHPDILPVGRNGQVKSFGSRRHYDFSSTVYREHSQRITQAIAQRYGRHPAVVGWQTDNEFGWGDTAQSFSPAAHAAFHAWLERRYGTVDALNDAWGNVFWSMEYTAWAQVPLPHHAVSEINPAHALDFLRFSSSEVAAFQAEQLALLREYSPGRFITHNYMGFFSAYDHYEVSRGLDFASWDSYPTGTLQAIHEWKLLDPQFARDYARTGHPDITAFNHDLYRGMVTPGAGQAVPGFWVMEQQCGQVNWAPANPLPALGAVRLWTEQAWAHGADAVSYFRWRAATVGQEVLHSGLLRHSGQPDQGYLEVAALRPQNLPLVPPQVRVALLHDYESLWLYNLQPHSQELNYWAQTFTYYRALRMLGVTVDILHPDRDLSGYDVVVAPALTLMTPERAAHLVASAGHSRLVFGPRTAFRTAAGGTPETGQFGDLASLVGASLGRYDSLYADMVQDVEGEDGERHGAWAWAESYDLAGAEGLWHYRGGPLDGEAAVIRHGSVTTIGAHSEALVCNVLRGVLHEAGVETTELPEGVRLTRRGPHTLLQNWTGQPAYWQGRTLAPYSSALLSQEVMV